METKGVVREVELDSKNRLNLQMFWKEATRPIWSMLIPPRGSNVHEWALYRQYHVASSLDEPSGLFGPAKKLHPEKWEQLGVHEEVVAAVREGVPIQLESEPPRKEKANQPSTADPRCLAELKRYEVEVGALDSEGPLLQTSYSGTYALHSEGRDGESKSLL